MSDAVTNSFYESDKWWDALYRTCDPLGIQVVEVELSRLQATKEEYYWAYVYGGRDELRFAFRFLEFVRAFYPHTWRSWLSSTNKEGPQPELINAGELFCKLETFRTADNNLGFIYGGKTTIDSDRRTDATSQAASFYYGDTSIRFGTFEIIGKQDFIKQVVSSLALLERQAQEEFLIVERYIGRIREWYQSGITVYEIPPIFYMSRKVAFPSLTWCAGVLVHEAWHSKLYNEYKAAHEAEVVPGHIYHGQEIELECNRIQLSALRKCDAPSFEINYLSSQDGSHWNQGWGDEGLRPY